MKTSLLVFYAVAAGLALLPIVVFFVALARKKHVRRPYHVLFILFAVLMMLCALAAGAFAVVLRYAPLKTAAGSIGDKLYVFYNGKQLFAVPKIGYAATLFAELKLIGVIVPFAVFGLYFIATVTVGVKTYRKKRKDKKNAAKEQTASSEKDGEALSNQFDEPVSTEHTASLSDEHTDENIEEFNVSPELAHDPSQTATEYVEPMPSDTAKRIVDAIDALVDDTAPVVETASSDIDTQLQRAIREGYALFEDAPADMSETDEMTVEDETSHEEETSSIEDEEPVDEAYSEDEEPVEGETYSDTEDETFAADMAEDETPAEDTTIGEGDLYEKDDPIEGSAYSERETANDVPSARERAKERQDERTVSPATKAARVSDFSDVDPLKPTHVRTIVRRPPARSGDELSRYAAQVEEKRELKDKTISHEPAESAGKRPEPQKASPSASVAAQKKASSKPAAARKRATGNAVKSGGTKAKTPVKKPQAEQPSHKDVTAEANSLPLTRKYIILNRRSAAAIFNEYLNSKRDKEKEELTESLNTIIIK